MNTFEMALGFFQTSMHYILIISVVALLIASSYKFYKKLSTKR